MAPSLPEKHTVVRMQKRPVGNIVPGQDLVALAEPTPKGADLKKDEVLLHRLFLSLDPAMRGWMRDIPSYVPPVQVGAVMRGATVSEVVASNNPKFSVGDIVNDRGPMEGWSEFAVDGAQELEKVTTSASQGLPHSAHLGVLGLTGLTAYFGLLRVGEPKAGETVLVSGAAGATGSVVCQVAKIKGCKVVGIAGGADKCRWLKEELGLDAVVDYKAAKNPEAFQKLLRQGLKEAGSKGADVFFDNVGGFILNEAIRRMNQQARIVICGAISGYNAEDIRGSEVQGPTNYMALITLRAKMQGFVVFDYVKEYPQAIAELTGWIREGKMKFKEDVRQGLEKAPEALLSLFDGGNVGKLVVKVGEPMTAPAAVPASKL